MPSTLHIRALYYLIPYLKSPIMLFSVEQSWSLSGVIMPFFVTQCFMMKAML